MKKEQWLEGIGNAILFCTEILFCYGILSYIFGMIEGHANGYYQLFSWMVISGSLLLELLVRLARKKCEKNFISEGVIEKAGVIVLACLMKQRLALTCGGLNLVLIVLEYFKEKRVPTWAYRVMWMGIVMLEVLFIMGEMQAGYTGLLDGYLLIYAAVLAGMQTDLAREVCYCGNEKKFGWSVRIARKVFQKEGKQGWKSLFFTALKDCSFLAMLVLVSFFEKGTTSNRNAWLVGTGVIYFTALCCKETEKKKRIRDTNDTINSFLYSVVPDCFAMIVIWFGAGIFLCTQSVLLGITMILWLTAELALRFVCLETGWIRAEISNTLRIVFLRLMVISSALILHTVYDGIFMNGDTVRFLIWCALALSLTCRVEKDTDAVVENLFGED